MGNCWRMPEDHSDLLYALPDQDVSSPTSSSTFSSPSARSTLAQTNFNTLDAFIPKLVTLNRPSTDLSVIRAAQSRNLVEHLPLVEFNEKTSQQTDCAICLIDFVANEQVRQLPCDGAHVFHPTCIDQWLEKSLTCPHCSTNVDAALLMRFIPQSSNRDDD